MPKKYKFSIVDAGGSYFSESGKRYEIFIDNYFLLSDTVIVTIICKKTIQNVFKEETIIEYFEPYDCYGDEKGLLNLIQNSNDFQNKLLLTKDNMDALDFVFKIGLSEFKFEAELNDL